MGIFTADCDICLSRIRDDGSCSCSKGHESRKKKIEGKRANLPCHDCDMCGFCKKRV